MSVGACARVRARACALAPACLRVRARACVLARGAWVRGWDGGGPRYIQFFCTPSHSSSTSCARVRAAEPTGSGWEGTGHKRRSGWAG